MEADLSVGPCGMGLHPLAAPGRERVHKPSAARHQSVREVPGLPARLDDQKVAGDLARHFVGNRPKQEPGGRLHAL